MPFGRVRKVLRRLTTARSCRGPASVRRPSRLLFRQRDGVTAVAVRHSLHGSSLAATAARSGFGTWALGRAAQAIDVRWTRVESPSMARTPRWEARPAKDGVGVVHLSKWGYFADFIRQEMLSARSYIWRGQAAAKWKLESTLDRLLRRRGKLKDPTIRDQHLRRFKLSSRGRRGANPAQLISDNDWWALGQHFGLATPLLDWTTSPYVAAYFAYAAEDNDGDSRRAVFALGRKSVTQKTLEITRTADPEAGRPDIVEFLEPLSDENSRLVSQGGLFTRAPDASTIEEWVSDNFVGDVGVWRLLKITLPSADRSVALQTLNRMNINHLSLFPDLYGASKFTNLDLLIDNY